MVILLPCTRQSLCRRMGGMVGYLSSRVLVIYQAASIADGASEGLRLLRTLVFASQNAEALWANVEHNEVFLSTMRASSLTVDDVVSYELLPAVAALKLVHREPKRIILFHRICSPPSEALQSRPYRTERPAQARPCCIRLQKHSHLPCVRFPPYSAYQQRQCKILLRSCG